MFLIRIVISREDIYDVSSDYAALHLKKQTKTFYGCPKWGELIISWKHWLNKIKEIYIYIHIRWERIGKRICIHLEVGDSNRKSHICIYFVKRNQDKFTKNVFKGEI